MINFIVLQTQIYIYIYPYPIFSGGNNSVVLGKISMFADDSSFLFWLGNKDDENGK